jgi:hypothetical protein
VIYGFQIRHSVKVRWELGVGASRWVEELGASWRPISRGFQEGQSPLIRRINGL